MSKEINISKILSHWAVGTKLYSPIIGDVSLVEVYSSDSGSDMFLVKGQNDLGSNIDLEFCPNGHFFYATHNAECLIFPSKKMRDWSKFAWQRGNVLVYNNGKVEVIFERFNDDEYTTFFGRHYLLNKEEKVSDISSVPKTLTSKQRMLLKTLSKSLKKKLVVNSIAKLWI